MLYVIFFFFNIICFALNELYRRKIAEKPTSASNNNNNNNNNSDESEATSHRERKMLHAAADCGHHPSLSSHVAAHTFPPSDHMEPSVSTNKPHDFIQVSSSLLKHIDYLANQSSICRQLITGLLHAPVEQ